MEETTAHLEDEPLWSLLHDIALMYIVIAHGSNNRLAEEEIGAMVMRLSVWQPDLDEDAIRQILRETLQFYATGPSTQDIQDSTNAIYDTLSRAQRLEILNDITFITEAEGPISAVGQDMIEMLAEAWKVDVKPGGER